MVQVLEQARHPRLEAIPLLSRAASSAGSKQVWQATSRRLRPISGCADDTRENAVGKIDLWHEEQATPHRSANAVAVVFSASGTTTRRRTVGRAFIGDRRPQADTGVLFRSARPVPN